MTSDGKQHVALIRDPATAAYDFGPAHPLSPLRVELTHGLIDATGLSARPDVDVVVASGTPEEHREHLLHVHDADYVATVEALSRALAAIGPAARLETAPEELRRRAVTVGLGEGDTPAFGGMHDASLAVVGATIEAARLVIEGRARHAFNPGGGLHHAMPDRAGGFCVYNDVGGAIDWMLHHGVERIAYIDVDVHHGDGVERMFRDDPRVLTLSLHESGRMLFPGTGEVAEIGGDGARGLAVNVPLAPQTTGEVWLEAFDALVEPLVRAFRPDVLITQLGCDTHANDPLAHLALTVDDMAEIYARLHRLAHEAAGGRWVATGGGGYQAVDVVPRAWTMAFAQMADATLPLEVPMPWQEMVVARFGATPPRTFDDPRPGVSAEAISGARAFAHDSIRAVRELVFPLHGLR